METIGKHSKFSIPGGPKALHPLSFGGSVGFSVLGFTYHMIKSV